MKVKEYIKNFLAARHCSFSQSIGAGVPQGDPLSMVLFCMVIDPIIVELRKKYHPTVYADDFAVLHESSVSSNTIIEEAEVLFHRKGLTLQKDKCHST